MIRRLCWLLGFVYAVAAFPLWASARQMHEGPVPPATVPGLLVSDIHFDPLHDPGKARKLFDSPVSAWAGILGGPASAEAGEFGEIQKSCRARGVDTPYPLLRSSLQAMKAHEPRPAFITVSGDLVAHSFDCRFESALKTMEPGAYAAFVVKTIAFVVGQLRAEFPGVPLYVSLGNNDSGCGDYRLDPGSAWLRAVAAVVAQGVPATQRPEVMKEFPEDGSYSVEMAAPIRQTRLIVLNDIFLSPQYRTCRGTTDDKAADSELDWLEGQLAEARRSGERVWVMGHIPPGVNAYATVRHFRNVCGHEKADLFLEPDRLDDLLEQYADVVRLALFGHTHMDEMRLIRPEGGGSEGVAAKLVASISPVDGNNPSFTMARVEPASADLKDFTVVEASNHNGVGATWREEYDFDRTYHETEYSPAAVADLMRGFTADKKALTPTSRAYIAHYFKGNLSHELTPFWPQYACSLANTTAQGFAGCVCGAGK